MKHVTPPRSTRRSAAASPSAESVPKSAASPPLTASPAKSTRNTSSSELLQHIAVVHRAVIPSLLSQESPPPNYRGIVNLGVALLFASTLKQTIDSVRAHGFLLDTSVLLQVPPKSIFYGAVSVGLMVVHICVSLCLEKAALRMRLVKNGMFWNVVLCNTFALLMQSTWMVWRHIRHFVLGCGILTFNVVLFMKLTSYHLVNEALRRLHFHRQNAYTSPSLAALHDPFTQEAATFYEACAYPANISASNVFYFWVAPTLCYQPVYPRTPHRRKTFIAKRLLELFSCLGVGHLLLHQFTLPEVKRSVANLLQGDYVLIAENILTIAISSLYCWLLMFYALFQVFLNLLAELLRFGDREFYQAWWNARSIDEYWRLWNAPVHNWFKRHVYLPLRHAYGLSAYAAQFTVFGISAVLHEYLIAVPTHIVRLWAFWAIVAQLPLILFTSWWLRRFPHSSFGNYFFWFVFCLIGQPICFVLYYRAAVTRNSPDAVLIGIF